MNIAIVTSCYGYGKYLGDWAASILALSEPPAQVGIYTHGALPDDTAAAQAALAALEAGGLTVRFGSHADQQPFGVARNAAVALIDTEWVMHLDADDMLMPHALRDVAALAPRCDVVALGYERVGDLAAGPAQRRKLYQSSAGPTMLLNPTPCSGVSPFRRSFWARHPYDPKMTGGWDTALWVGFAHLGARVLPTRRPCFWYRQHADSIFNTRRLSAWPAARVGAELQSRRRGDRGVSILVPRSSPDAGSRDRAWGWLKARYATLHPDWELIEGLSPARPWVKGDAVEAALERAHGTVIVVADADCVVSAGALREAVARVEAGASWVVPHGLVYRLTRDHAAAWMASVPAPSAEEPPGAGLEREPYVGFAGGGIFVAPRAAFAATGGIPRSFLGWGAEDETLALILDTLLGPHERLGAPLIHLWHEPQPNRAASSQVNRMQLLQFRQVAHHQEAMWQLLHSAQGLSLGAVVALDRGHRAAVSREVLSHTLFDPFGQRRLAALRPRNAMAMQGTRFAGGKMHTGPATNKMLGGGFENKQSRRFTQEAAELVRQHRLTADDFSEVPAHRTVSLGIVKRVLAARGAA